MRLEAVFFDAGETLLAPHPSFHELFALVVTEEGYERTAAEVTVVFENMAPTFAEVMDKLAAGQWSVSREASLKFWGTLYSTALAELGIPDPEGRVAKALYRRFTRYESYRLFPDVVPALAEVKQAGLRLGLISNFEEWLEGMLIEMEVAPFFELMVISGKEGIEKPDPAIFRLALERSGIDPARAVYVGDHPRIDVEAARAVGMEAVLIDRRERYPQFEGTRIATLRELLPALEQVHA